MMLINDDDGMKLSHTFPSGLCVEIENRVEQNYKEELNALTSDNELKTFIERWRWLFPEIEFTEQEPNIDTIKLLQSEDVQKQYIEKIDSGDKIAAIYLNLLVPSSMVYYAILGEKYGVPMGTIILQLWNAGRISEQAGVWYLQMKSSKP